jgi:plastocyanin
VRVPGIALVAAVGGVLLVPAVPLAADQPAAPTAALESASSSVPAGTKLKLDSSHSTGAIVGHQWDLDGNGSFETDSGAKPTVELVPKQAGPLTVHVKVVDAQGQSAEAALALTVTDPPRMTATAQAGPAAQDSAGTTAPKHPPASGPGAGSTRSSRPSARPHPRAGHSHGGASATRSHATKHADPAAAPTVPAPAPAPVAPVMARAPAALAQVPLMVASKRLATAPARRARTTAHAAGSSGVTIKNFAFSPGSVTVNVGDTVTWTNQDSVPHTATAKDGSFDTGIIQKAGSGSHTFTKPGTIAYICSVHPNMHGTIVVSAVSAGGSAPAASSGGSGSGSGGSTPSATTAATPSSSGGLPHTGLDLVAVVLMAMVLMGSGSALRSVAGRER